MTVFIDIVGPDGSRTVAVPTADVTIGSGADNDIQLVHDDVAARHTLVIERGGHAVVLDTSGRGQNTLVNNHAITEATILSSLCQVGVGPFRMRFRHVDLPPDTQQTVTQPLNERPAPPPPTTKRTGDFELPAASFGSDPRISSAAPTPRRLMLDSVVESSQRPPESLPPNTAEPSVVRGLLVASNDAVELEFIRAILEDEDDPNDARLVYADWLEQRGDATRAHYMRLVSELESHVNANYIQQERLREAGKYLAPPWRATVAPRWLPIERCPLGEDEDSQVLRPCPQTWGRVGRGSVDDLRRCTSCTRYVQYITAIEEGQKAVARGNPVVIDAGVIREPNDLAVSPSRPAFVPHVVYGRRPSGGETGCAPGDPRDRRSAPTIDEFFADAAALEALSVTAFEWLAADLAKLGAPIALQRRALEAAIEETRHTRAMADLARAFGAERVTFAPPHAPDCRRRASTKARVDVAIGNAVEGCVRESFGARVAEWQANHATAESVRRELRIIAIEEESHAQLARDIAAWIEPSLSAIERTRVNEAAAEARARLIASVTATEEPFAEDVRRLSGHPSNAEAYALLLGG